MFVWLRGDRECGEHGVGCMHETRPYQCLRDCAKDFNLCFKSNKQFLQGFSREVTCSDNKCFLKGHHSN